MRDRIDWENLQVSIPSAVLETAHDELRGCLFRRSGHACEVRKEYLQVALEAMARFSCLQSPASGLKPPVETGTGSMRSTKAAVPKGQAPTTPSTVNQGEAEILRERAQVVKWLRANPAMFVPKLEYSVTAFIADAIERGEHLTAFLQPLASPQ